MIVRTLYIQFVTIAVSYVIAKSNELIADLKHEQADRSFLFSFFMYIYVN
jgi:hypothetical protein